MPNGTYAWVLDGQATDAIGLKPGEATSATVSGAGRTHAESGR
jgi:hypothetical protein